MKSQLRWLRYQYLVVREFREMSDKDFLKSGKRGWTPKFLRIWKEEFARRFYVRPLEAHPNTQDGTTLVRAI
jgi:hypothetical protein